MRKKNKKKNKKTTKKQLAQFKKSFTKWQLRLGLHEWDVSFRLDDLDGNQAILRSNSTAFTATAFLDKDASVLSDSLTFLGQHEAFHLLIAYFDAAASERYVTAHELRVENEKIVNRLQRAFPVKQPIKD